MTLRPDLRRGRVLEWICGMALSFSAQADQPPPHGQVWVDVAVSSCSRGESLLTLGMRWLVDDDPSQRVGLIAGKVVDAGFFAPAPDTRVEKLRSTDALPAIGSDISLVLPAWTAAVCKGMSNENPDKNVRRFLFDYRCDVAGLGGVCSHKELGRLANLIETPR